jgi:hypothetical protein
MLRRTIVLGICALFAAAPVAAQSQDKAKLGNIPIASLFHGMDMSGASFEVVDSRFQETAAAAVMFGLIGAAINSGINGNEDIEKAKPYAAAAGKLEPGRIMSEKISATLAAKTFPLAEGEKGASHTLRVEIKEWGLTRTAFNDPRMSTFIRLHLIMKQGKKVVWDTYLKDSGGRAAVLSDITSDMLVQDIEALAAKMGERIAYEIIYR